MNRMMLRRRVLMASLMNSGLSLSDLPEGSLAAIDESGSPVLFYLAKHDYESGLNGAGRTMFVRKDCYDERKWNSNNAKWVVIDAGLAGTIDNPILAARGMEYEHGKYYLDPEDGKTYLCKRLNETGTIVLYYLPHELIGQYFEEVN